MFVVQSRPLLLHGMSDRSLESTQTGLSADCRLPCEEKEGRTLQNANEDAQANHPEKRGSSDKQIRCQKSARPSRHPVLRPGEKPCSRLYGHYVLHGAAVHDDAGQDAGCLVGPTDCPNQAIDRYDRRHAGHGSSPRAWNCARVSYVWHRFREMNENNNNTFS
jgi:hypothetical protein